MKPICSAAILIAAAADRMHTLNTPIAEGWAKVLASMVPWIERLEAEPIPANHGAAGGHVGPVAAILNERVNHE